MHSSLTSKGQVTVPSKLRRLLNLQAGDRVEFAIENNHVVLFKKIDSVEASFGICKPKRSASLKNMEDAIRSKGSKK